MGLTDTYGTVRLHWPTEDLPHFWLTADLSNAVTGDNHAGEARIKKLLPDDLVNRIDWDSESGQFFANADSYTDARQVAEVIAGLHQFEIREVME